MRGDPYNDYLTTAEAAKMLKMSVHTVRYHIYQGNLPCKRPSMKLILIPRKAVVNFVRRPAGRPRINGHRKRRKS